VSQQNYLKVVFCDTVYIAAAEDTSASELHQQESGDGASHHHHHQQQQQQQQATVSSTSPMTTTPGPSTASVCSTTRTYGVQQTGGSTSQLAADLVSAASPDDQHAAVADKHAVSLRENSELYHRSVVIGLHTIGMILYKQLMLGYI